MRSNGTKSLMFSLNQGSRLLHHPHTPSVLCFVKYKSLTQATRLSILFGISLLLSLPCLLKDGGLRGGDAGSHPLTLHTVRVHSAQLITSVPRAQSSHSPEPGKLLRGPSRTALSTQDSPAKALEIRSFFHSQGWSYSSGGLSSSSGRRDSRGQGAPSPSGVAPSSSGS